MTSEATRTTAPARPAIETPDGRFEFAAHNCFGCGTLNAGGIGMVLHVEAGRAWTELALDRRFEGWDGVIHGGILCAILDEVMAWALVGEDNWGVTARMAVAFRKPVAVDTPIRAEGWITRARRRIVETEGHIVDAATGIELATATGYVRRGRPCPQARPPRALCISATGLAATTRLAIRPDRWTPLDDDGHARIVPESTTSEVTARAVAFVAAHRDAAEALGTTLADYSNDPEGLRDRPDTGPRRWRTGVSGRATKDRARDRGHPRRPLATARRSPARLPERLEGLAVDASPVHRRSALP